MCAHSADTSPLLLPLLLFAPPWPVRIAFACALRPERGGASSMAELFLSFPPSHPPCRATWVRRMGRGAGVLAGAGAV